MHSRFLPAGKCRLGRCREGSAWGDRELPAPTGAAFPPNQAEPGEPYKNDLENKKLLLGKCWLKGLKVHAEKENIV